jgi:hypothetical protein
LSVNVVAGVSVAAGIVVSVPVRLHGNEVALPVEAGLSGIEVSP